MEKGPSAKPRVNDFDSNENDNNNDEGLDVENNEEDQDLYKEFTNGGSNMRHMSFFFFFFFYFSFFEFFCLVAEKVLRKLGKNCISEFRLKFKLVL